MERFSTARRLGPRLALGLLVSAVAVGSFVVARGPGQLTTYAGHSMLAMALSLGAGLALLAAGLTAVFGRSSQRISDLALVASLGWFSLTYVGWNGGPPLVRTLATIVAGFTFPLLAHLVLVYPEGRVRESAHRRLLWAVYCEAAVVAGVLTLFRDPFYDPSCWSNCTDNVFLVGSLPNVTRAVVAADRSFTVAAAGVFAGLCLRLLARSDPRRRVLLPVVIPAVIFALATAAHAVARSLIQPENPSEPPYFAIFGVASAAVILLAAGVVWGSLRTRLQRTAVARIVTQLGETPQPGSLETALRQAIDDSDLRIVYWLPAGRLVDANGQAMDEPARVPGRVNTTLVRDDQPIAVISHTARLVDIESELGPAVRLALENERLQAESLSNLDELQASRARIVQTGDDERRRIERDLHDGAQQRLLAVSYDIRLALRAADTDGDTDARPILTTALAVAQAALDELRELAHGIYPAILEQAGLAPALASLGDTAPVHLSLRDVPEQRLPPAVETTAYLLVAEAVADAADRDADHAVVTAWVSEEELSITVEDDGSPRTSSMTRIADRVGALGGDIVTEPTALRARIPCA